MSIKKRLIAVFVISRKVAVFIDDLTALMAKLTTAPGNTFITLAPAIVTAINGRLANLVTAQATAATRAQGTAAARDVVLVTCINDVNMLKAEVQLAADDAADDLIAREI